MVHNSEIIAKNYIQGLTKLLPGQVPEIDIKTNQLEIGTVYKACNGKDRLAGAMIVFNPAGARVTMWLNGREPVLIFGGKPLSRTIQKKVMDHVLKFLEAMNCPAELPLLERKKGQERIISLVVAFNEENEV